MSEKHERPRPTRQGLAGRLRMLREATVPRISQTAAAQTIGASQNKISRAESGEWVLDPEEVKALARLYGASRPIQEQLVDWAKALAAEEVDSRLMLRRGGGTAAFQARIRRMEQGAAEVRAFQPGMVLGMLQTERYAAEVFGGDIAAVAERVRRAQQLLIDDSRSWQLVQPVGALLWNLGGPEVMAEQMDAMYAASKLRHVDLRIITAEQQVNFTATHGFHLYDRQAVVVGILTGTTVSTETADIDQYRALFDKLMASALSGDRAREVLSQLAGEYRHAVDNPGR